MRCLDRRVVLDALADHRWVFDFDDPAGVEPRRPEDAVGLGFDTRMRGFGGRLLPGFLSQCRRAGKRGEKRKRGRRSRQEVTATHSAAGVNAMHETAPHVKGKVSESSISVPRIFTQIIVASTREEREPANWQVMEEMDGWNDAILGIRSA